MKWALAVLVAALVVVFLAAMAAVLTFPAVAAKDSLSVPKLTHQQEVWIHALEWCESRGVADAVNPNDLDNTPSYGAFQFKPSTLEMFARKYGIATTTVMDYSVQRAVVEQMVLHRGEIKWENQFPWCVKKLGRPPK